VASERGAGYGLAVLVCDPPDVSNGALLRTPSPTPTKGAGSDRALVPVMFGFSYQTGSPFRTAVMRRNVGLIPAESVTDATAFRARYSLARSSAVCRCLPRYCCCTPLYVGSMAEPSLPARPFLRPSTHRPAGSIPIPLGSIAACGVTCFAPQRRSSGLGPRTARLPRVRPRPIRCGGHEYGPQELPHGHDNLG
jgi:hypothetical protein